MIVIVDYQMGNVGSIANMLKRVGAPAKITSDIEEIRVATKLILPGVGAFDTGMENIDRLGLRDVLDAKALRERVPVLGICLGMHLMTRQSEEGHQPGLGWIEGSTVRFRFDGDPNLRVPHMGWNAVVPRSYRTLFAGLEDEAVFYFVHSFYVRCNDDADVLGTTTYGIPFASSIERQNLYGAQFHPEKSHKYGMRLLKNFAELPC